MPGNTYSPAVVVDTSQSPFARLRPVPVTAVTLSDGFWAPRWRINRDLTLPSQYHLLEETGRLDNFRRASGKIKRDFKGWFFNDSDVYKWLEGLAWTLALDPDPALAKMADDTIAEIGLAQQPDGYLDTYFMFERAAQRWSNLPDLHELYCAGHLFQAAVAHQRAMGSRRLLDIAVRLADHICATFGPREAGKRPGTCGHPEIEMGLIELARETGETRYLEQALYFINMRGQGLAGGDVYRQDHKPLREFDRMEGHAVRACYLNSGATDIYLETGEKALINTLERQWRTLVERQIYVNGGLGPRYEFEAFGMDYELPSARAYCETCAAIAGIMWYWRMLAIDGDARYADLLETTLFNAILPGISLDGKSYFYVNPLSSEGKHPRQPWYACACCPPNIARLIASLPGYFYSRTNDGIYVHLYAGSEAAISLPDGRSIELIQNTHYPWDGNVEIEVVGDGEFALWLRVPGWAQNGAELTVNEDPVEALPGTYAEIRRTWHGGDTVRLYLPMPVRRMESHPYVLENNGRVALMRGPLLYCVEEADHPGADLRNLILPGDSALAASYRADLLGGAVMLVGRGLVARPDPGWDWQLYRTVEAASVPDEARPVEITAIPYFAWANREPGAMQVWLKSG